jgi:hypothetical protein
MLTTHSRMKFFYLLASLSAMALAAPSPQTLPGICLTLGATCKTILGSFGTCCEGLECVSSPFILAMSVSFM